MVLANYGKIQMDIIKDVERSRTSLKQLTKYKYGFTTFENKDYVVLIVDEIAAVCVPTEWCYLDMKKILGEENLLDVERLFNFALTDLQELYRQKMIKQLSNCKVEIFNDNDGNEVYLNEKYLRCFGNIKEYSYKRLNKDGLTVIYLDDTIIGLVSPVTH